VASSYPLGDILQNCDANGRVVKWSVELGAFTIEFMPLTIMSKAMSDFIAECTEIQDRPPDTRAHSGAGRHYYSPCLRDAASNPTQGLGAVTTRYVSVTQPVALFGN